MNEKILIINYEPDILRTLENILTNEGYQVRSASGSEEAIDVLKSESFGLVIMDIRIPGVDGVEFMKQVKELVDDIEIVFLTGSPRMENAVKALRDDGAYDFLTMPMENVDQLINTVKRALRKQKLKKNR
ncbi:MAG: response regulator [Desulfobacteraceae bacterium]|nr:response regulator [Desulfobacteraceae bacterium]